MVASTATEPSPGTDTLVYFAEDFWTILQKWPIRGEHPRKTFVLLVGHAETLEVQFSISEQLLLCTEKGFQGDHELQARRLLYHSSLGRE